MICRMGKAVLVCQKSGSVINVGVKFHTSTQSTLMFNFTHLPS